MYNTKIQYNITFCDHILQFNKVNMRYIVPITIYSYTRLSDESGLPQVDSYGGPGEWIHTASLDRLSLPSR